MKSVNLTLLLIAVTLSKFYVLSSPIISSASLLNRRHIIQAPDRWPGSFFGRVPFVAEPFEYQDGIGASNESYRKDYEIFEVEDEDYSVEEDTELPATKDDTEKDLKIRKLRDTVKEMYETSDMNRDPSPSYMGISDSPDQNTSDPTNQDNAILIPSRNTLKDLIFDTTRGSKYNPLKLDSLHFIISNTSEIKETRYEDLDFPLFYTAGLADWDSANSTGALKQVKIPLNQCNSIAEGPPETHLEFLLRHLISSKMNCEDYPGKNVFGDLKQFKRDLRGMNMSTALSEDYQELVPDVYMGDSKNDDVEDALDIIIDAIDWDAANSTGVFKRVDLSFPNSLSEGYLKYQAV